MPLFEDPSYIWPVYRPFPPFITPIQAPQLIPAQVMYNNPNMAFVARVPPTQQVGQVPSSGTVTPVLSSVETSGSGSPGSNAQSSPTTRNGHDDARFKAIFCPFLDKRGHCKFTPDRCRYSHFKAQPKQNPEDETEITFDQLPSSSNTAGGSPQTQDTTPPEKATQNETNNNKAIPFKFQNNQKGSKRERGNKLLNNPPSRVYPAYEANVLPSEQVYKVVDRKNPLDETVISYTDKNGNRVARSDLKEIRFEKDFGKVFDAHLQAITDRKNIANNLDYISISNASGLTDEAIIGLGVLANPKVIILNNAINITDAAFIGLCINCKDLEYLEVNGLGRKGGRLTTSCLRMLTESPTVAPNLKEIVIKHQSFDTSAGIELTKVRKNLAITVGNITPETVNYDVHLIHGGRVVYTNHYHIK